MHPAPIEQNLKILVWLFRASMRPKVSGFPNCLLKKRGHYYMCYMYSTKGIENAANFEDLLFVSMIMILYQKIIRIASNIAKKA
jgi:hypothetical protein